MKPILSKPMLASLLLALASGAASAQSTIPMLNPGFEQPATVKIQTGFDVAGSDVPGWLNTGTTYTDTGVEAFAAHGGAWRAFAQSTDGGAYQISVYQMQEGDSLSLTWWATDGWNSSVQTVNLVSAAAGDTAFANTVVLATQNNTLGAWTEYAMNYTATAADAGKYVGISFINSKAGNGSWAAWDDFSLTVTPVPEPATAALAGTGLLIGIMLRRRRA